MLYSNSFTFGNMKSHVNKLDNPNTQNKISKFDIVIRRFMKIRQEKRNVSHLIMALAHEAIPIKILCDRLAGNDYIIVSLDHPSYDNKSTHNPSTWAKEFLAIKKDIPDQNNKSTQK